jgi:CubicO group peptidase (beta-lactamase class C family)
MAEVSGLRYGDGDNQPLLRKHCDRLLDALPVFKDDALLFEPGSKASHSAYAWILVSAAIEAASHQPFMTFMEREVFKPLGLNGTMADPGAEPMGERAALYFPLVRFVLALNAGKLLPSDTSACCNRRSPSIQGKRPGTDSDGASTRCRWTMRRPAWWAVMRV